MRFACLLLALIATPLAAQPDHRAIGERALSEMILPGVRSFAAEASALAAAAPPVCAEIDGEALRTQFGKVWDAWLGIEPLGFGPLEEDNRALQIALFPDSRGAVGKTVARMVRSEDAKAADPAEIGGISIAARGLYGMERLLYDEAGAIALTEPYRCRYVHAVAADLARLGAEVDTGWREVWAGHVREAGLSESSPYLAPDEVSQRLLATFQGAMGLTIRFRLAAPLGNLERTRPRLAEARRAGRSLRHIRLSIEASDLLGREVFGPALSANTQDVIETSLTRARNALAAVEELGTLPEALEASRIRVEVLMQSMQDISNAMALAGAEMGISPGFNSADGD